MCTEVKIVWKSFVNPEEYATKMINLQKNEVINKRATRIT